MSSKERKALGKGFSALIPTIDNKPANSSKTTIEEGFHYIPVSRIFPNPKQPRRTFNPEKLAELAQSIKVKGVIQPITVRIRKRGKDEFELIAGERRLKASKIAGLEKIPAMVTKTEDEHMLEISLIENIQRHDLNPIDEGMAYQALLNEHGFTQEDLSKRIGKNRSTIANLIRLLQLPQSIKQEVIEERLSMGHARSLLAIEDIEKQQELKDLIIEKNLSVREIENLIRQPEQKLKKPASAAPSPTKEVLSPQMGANQERLKERYATKVSVIPKKGDVGKIEIEYYGKEEFNRIFALLMQQGS